MCRYKKNSPLYKIHLCTIIQAPNNLISTGKNCPGDWLSWKSTCQACMKLRVLSSASHNTVCGTWLESQHSGVNAEGAVQGHLLAIQCIHASLHYVRSYPKKEKAVLLIKNHDKQ